MKSKPILKLNPKEIAEISKLLTETVIQQLNQHPEIFEIPVKEIEIPKDMPIIPEEEITHVIDLELIATGTFGITDPLGQLQDWFVSTISSTTNWIVSSIQAWINDNVLPVFDSLYSNVTSWINTYVIPAVSGVVSSISDFITENVLPAFDNLYSSISDFITENVLPVFNALASSISSYIDIAVSSIGGAVTNAVTSISTFISSVEENITRVIADVSGAISSLGSSIMSSITAVIDAISSTASTIVASITNVISNIGSTLNSIGNFIVQSATSTWNLINSMFGTLSTTIVNGLTSLGSSVQGIWTFLIDQFTNISAYIGAGFQSISTTFMGFSNAILQLPTLFEFSLQHMGEWIWNATPDWLRTPIENIGKTFTEGLANAVTTFSETFQTFISDPSSWFKTNVVEPSLGFLNFLGGEASNLITFIMNTLKSVWQTAQSSVSGFMKFIGDAISGFLKGTYESLGKVSELFKPVFETAYSPVSASTGKEISSTLKPFFKDVFKQLGIGTPEYLTLDFVTSQLIGQFTLTTALAFSPFWAQIPVRLSSFLLHNIGQFVYGLDIPITINLKPLGIGVDVTFNLAKAIGASLSHFGKEMKQWVDEIGRGIVYGFAIWTTQPISKTLNYLLRNTIPIELPQLNVISDFTRRSLPHENFGELVKLARYYMALYGYSDYVIDLFFKSAEEYNIEVTDRFGTARKIPLALVYNMPSSSDVAKMAIRDIFGAGGTAIDNFLKIYQATGMHRDIGILYYMLHYKYPSPNYLWSFVTRGISGLLWADMSPALKEKIKQEANKLGAVTPTPAYAWNFKAKELFTAFQLYMTWHDYARFSWIKKEMIDSDKHFTSDNLIYIDTLADIPTKIDQRWMVKWGIYNFMAEKGVKFKSTIKDIAVKLIEDTPVSNIQMDLTVFSRTLQATGIHPYWVPVTAVAEAMNALSEERTYLRTGVINLFKEGFISRDSLKSVFAGVFKVSFKVAYFDINDYTWKTGYVNLPVMYLPAERELLALRADMDRVLDILREIQRDISRAFQESIISSYDEYKANLVKVIENLQNIAPEKVNLEFIEEYYKPYVEALKIYQQVYTIRRMRSWAMRWLGWIMYRVATGIVTENELTNLINTLVKYAKLTKIEEQFFADVMKVMRGIAVKEYIPTPSQIATLSEYLTIPEDLVKQSFDVKMIPKNWRAIWSKYIAIRPVSDDVKSLLTTYRRALLYTEIPAEMEKQVKELAKFIGFTDKEMSILQLRVALEELIQNRREYIPTPYSLATLVEYVPKAREFFNEVMKAKRVPERWQKIWAKYIDVRPLVSDVKKYLSRAENLYVRFMIQKEVFLKILNEVADYLGYTSKEIEFLMSATELERARNAWTELIGTVERMVSLSEYSPTASRYALGKLNAMIDSLPIPPSEKQELKKMWEEYIRNKPVKSEAKMYVTQLINLFVDGLISDSDFEKELQAMKEWGFSDHEIMFYKAQATLRKIRKLRIPISTAGG